jgi:sec-independent protein translocase protein TatA
MKTRYCAAVGYVSNPTHIAFLLLIALLLFGGKRLPEIGKSLGSGMREFKDSLTNHTSAEPAQQLPAPETPVAAAASQPTEHETV